MKPQTRQFRATSHYHLYERNVHTKPLRDYQSGLHSRSSSFRSKSFIRTPIPKEQSLRTKNTCKISSYNSITFYNRFVYGTPKRTYCTNKGDKIAVTEQEKDSTTKGLSNCCHFFSLFKNKMKKKKKLKKRKTRSQILQLEVLNLCPTTYLLDE